MLLLQMAITYVSINQNNMYQILYAIFVVGSTLFLKLNVYAAKTLNDSTAALDTVSNKTGITEPSITNIGGNVMKMLFFAIGLIFFILMVYAGFRWMTARDKSEKVEKARNTMIAAVIGLVILLAAYAVTTFIQTNVIGN